MSMGGTNYAPVLKEMVSYYKDIEPSEVPAFIIFITDGENWDTNETNKIVKELSNYNMFVQFIGIGDESFNYLRSLDHMEGRKHDNTGFTAVKDMNKILKAMYRSEKSKTNGKVCFILRKLICVDNKIFIVMFSIKHHALRIISSEIISGIINPRISRSISICIIIYQISRICHLPISISKHSIDVKINIGFSGVSILLPVHTNKKILYCRSIFLCHTDFQSGTAPSEFWYGK